MNVSSIITFDIDLSWQFFTVCHLGLLIIDPPYQKFVNLSFIPCLQTCKHMFLIPVINSKYCVESCKGSQDCSACFPMSKKQKQKCSESKRFCKTKLKCKNINGIHDSNTDHSTLLTMLSVLEAIKPYFDLFSCSYFQLRTSSQRK